MKSIKKQDHIIELDKNGYITTMTYTKTTTANNRNRARNVIWFNPPYNQSVKINIVKTILKLNKKVFSKRT